jgi:hypothetical protein
LYYTSDKDKEGVWGGLTLGRQEILGVVNDSHGDRGVGFWKSIRANAEAINGAATTPERHTYACIYMYEYVCVYIYICINICLYICMFIYVNMCIYGHKCIHMYTYVCLFKYMYQLREDWKGGFRKLTESSLVLEPPQYSSMLRDTIERNSSFFVQHMSH